MDGWSVLILNAPLWDGPLIVSHTHAGLERFGSSDGWMDSLALIEFSLGWIDVLGASSLGGWIFFNSGGAPRYYLLDGVGHVPGGRRAGGGISIRAT